MVQKSYLPKKAPLKIKHDHTSKTKLREDNCDCLTFFCEARRVYSYPLNDNEKHHQEECFRNPTGIQGRKKIHDKSQTLKRRSLAPTHTHGREGPNVRRRLYLLCGDDGGRSCLSMKWIRGYGTQLVWNSVMSTLRAPRKRSDAVREEIT